MVATALNVFLSALALFGHSTIVGEVRAANEVSQCLWLSPVDAPIVDPFRPPSHPFGGGGNRGLEFGTVGGEPVGAVAEGRVSFVGPVGGERWVVVTHDEVGLRSTYGPLVSTGVVRGQHVAPDELLGTAAPGLHLTARSAGRYLDPAPLLAGRCGRARLVAPRTSGRVGGSPTSSPATGETLRSANGGSGPVH